MSGGIKITRKTLHGICLRLYVDLDQASRVY